MDHGSEGEVDHDEALTRDPGEEGSTETGGGYVHQIHDGTLYDEESDSWLEGTIFATFKIVDGVEYGITARTGINPPAGMTEEAWISSWQRLNEVALTHRIKEQLNGS